MSELLAPTPLPAALASALKRLVQTCAETCEQSAQSLGLSALSASHIVQRDALLEAQNTLSRGTPQVVAAFGQALEGRLVQEWVPRGPAALELPTQWDELSLVDDQELDNQVAAERFAMTIGHASEWELRELDGFLRAIAEQRPSGQSPPRRNILRPENIGHAVIRAIDRLGVHPETRRLLEAEMARSWAARLPRLYAGLIGEMRASGLAPMAMSVRTSDRAAVGGRQPSAREHDRAGVPSRPSAFGAKGQVGRRVPARGVDEPCPRGGSHDSEAPGDLSAPGDASRPSGSATTQPPNGPGSDPGLMNLLRRLSADWPARDVRSTHTADAPSPATDPTPNLIHAHREELQHATRGAMDHMVIDVVGSLFDQILSDPKVPPQIAREIGRLQLPVLRTAIGDPSFFASRRHPVRRLINRIASLGAALDDLDDQPGRALVARVQDLVQGIVDGDFEQLGLYEQQLAQLESFVAEQGRQELEAQGGQPELLAERERDTRWQRRTARRLQAELQPLQAPDFLRNFIADVWSEVMVRNASLHGADSEPTRQARETARDLFMSIQPKGTPAQRQTFLKQLPTLMQQINRGMDMVGWPDEERRNFFGQLLPAHAQSLKGEGLRTLDFNLMLRQVERVLESALPRPAERDAPPSQPGSLDSDHAPLLTPGEARTVGLLAEDQVDWTAPLDIDLSEEPAVGPGDLAIQGMPEPEAPEPTRGRTLADHVQIGFAYQMHLEGRWHKVRLTHVSPGRAFYVFSRGQRHQRVLSLTRRMLVRLCEAGRLRAFENAYLLERATARARRQLAALKTPSAPMNA